MKPQTPYQIIKAEAAKKGLPVAFRDDLTQHDKHHLRPRKNAPDAFVWVLREHGTFLWDEPYPYSLVTLRYPHGDKTHFYTFSNRQLKEVNVDEAARFLTYELWGGLFADEAAKWGWLKEQPGFRNKHTDRFLTIRQMEEFISRGEVPPTHSYQRAVRVFSRTFL